MKPLLVAILIAISLGAVMVWVILPPPPRHTPDLQPFAPIAEQSPSPPPTITDQPRPPPTIEQIQASLKAQGFDPGPVDGILGPRTKAAITAWKARFGYKKEAGFGPHILSAIIESPALPPPPKRQQTMPARSPELLAVQRDLKHQGFYQGAVNGVWDDQTKAAILDYQDSAGLPKTGALDGRLLDHLRYTWPPLRREESARIPR